ncbi:hypothetical protein GQ54DRAFT_307509 [Martensiomyces pterosporus]|nr:hypothetical protein GQ54DRAFT_307509 [Martensiomyces pterosporus]
MAYGTNAAPNIVTVPVGPPAPVTPEDVENARRARLSETKSSFTLKSVICWLIGLVCAGLCAYYVSMLVQNRNKVFNNGTYLYTINDSYYIWRATICGIFAFIFLVAALCILVNYRRSMKWLKDPNTPGHLIVYGKNPNSSESANGYDTGDMTTTTIIVTNPPAYQQQQPYYQGNGVLAVYPIDSDMFVGMDLRLFPKIVWLANPFSLCIDDLQILIFGLVAVVCGGFTGYYACVLFVNREGRYTNYGFWSGPSYSTFVWIEAVCAVLFCLFLIATICIIRRYKKRMSMLKNPSTPEHFIAENKAV